MYSIGNNGYKKFPSLQKVLLSSVDGYFVDSSVQQPGATIERYI